MVLYFPTAPGVPIGWLCLSVTCCYALYTFERDTCSIIYKYSNVGVNVHNLHTYIGKCQKSAGHHPRQRYLPQIPYPPIMSGQSEAGHPCNTQSPRSTCLISYVRLVIRASRIKTLLYLYFVCLHSTTVNSHVNWYPTVKLDTVLVYL